jgi:hypothetical protein
MMSEDLEDIRATAEDLIGDAERLKQIERTKLELKPGDPRLAKLTDEANMIIARMQPKGQAQKQLITNGERA